MFQLILLATDNGEPTRTTHMETTIIITDKDDNLPYFERLVSGLVVRNG